MTFINPAPHAALPPPVAQPQVAVPRSQHAPTVIARPVREVEKKARILRERNEQEARDDSPNTGGLDLLV